MTASKMITSLFCFIAFTLCVLSCQKSANTPEPPPGGDTTSIPPVSSDSTSSDTSTSDVDVYVTGNHDDTAILWKNGKQNIISIGGESLACDVFVSGSDVYVIGTDSVGLGYYLKNGVRNELTGSYNPNSMSGVAARCIYVDGNNVYAGGSSSPNLHAAYWKNGIKTDIAGIQSYANSISVLNGAVYTAGDYIGATACYTKNSDVVELPGRENYSSSATKSIFISGDDIYLAGFGQTSDHSYAIYWKNGLATTLETGSPLTVEANAVSVSGTDVYVAGKNSFNLPVYWKNGTPNLLRNSFDSTGEATAIAVSGTDVYTAGSVSGLAAYWKNNEVHMLTKRPGHGSVTSIFVKKR